MDTETIDVLVESKFDEWSEPLGPSAENRINWRVQQIGKDTLQHSIRLLSKSISEMLNSIEPVTGYQLDQFCIQAEITAEGGIALLGSAKVGATGGVTLTFSRSAKVEDTNS